jgi:hypothetical protein
MTNIGLHNVLRLWIRLLQLFCNSINRINQDLTTATPDKYVSDLPIESFPPGVIGNSRRVVVVWLGRT